MKEKRWRKGMDSSNTQWEARAGGANVERLEVWLEAEGRLERIGQGEGEADVAARRTVGKANTCPHPGRELSCDPGRPGRCPRGKAWNVLFPSGIRAQGLRKCFE